MNAQVENLSNEPKVRVQFVLGLPSLPLRCQHLSSLLEEVSSKDSLYILRTIVESLFGTSDESLANIQQQNLGGGWGLRVITLSEHCYEFNSLRAFLSPTGPLLTLIYRLAHDPFQLLPFPIAWLSNKVRSEIEDGTANIFYTNKIQNLGPGKSPSNIMLNAFEYYMFHFTHFLVGSHTHHWNISWGAVNDALYLTLLEDYLLSFLPCDGSLPPGPPSIPVSPRGVLSPMAQRHLAQVTPHTPNLNLSNLVSPIARPVRPSTEPAYGGYPFLEMTSTSASIPGGHTSSPLPQSVASTFSSHQPQREVNTWTSQVFFQILLEMWINQCVPPVTKAPLHHQTPSSHFMSSRPSLRDVFVPSSDHVRVVRMMVKHFHYFSNSIKTSQANHLDYLKRNLWPLCRRSFYIFLKHLFLHWPLDSSFRLVLETWLSYIQPWRYTQFTPRLSPGQQLCDPDGPRLIERKWISFVSENLLFYTHLFVLLIGRLLRLDLVSPKSAQIIFRVAKVFSQDNLTSFIREIEDTLSSGNSMQRCFLSGTGANSLRMPTGSSPPLGSDQISSQQLVQLVRSHILEVEGPNHQYTPLFSEAIAYKASQFLKVAKNAQDAIAAELVTNCALSTANEMSSSRSWLDAFFKLFQSSQSVTDENTIDEVQRSLTHLELSIKYFCGIFKISAPVTGFPDSSDQNISSLKNISGIVGSPEKYHEPDMVSTDIGPMLTNLGRYQLMNGLKRLDLKYEGDPDLKPICSYEVTFLVRLLYHLSHSINQKYKFEIMDLFYRRDFFGRLSRVFLTPPQTVFEYSKCNPDSPHKRVSKILPPRVSLRGFANKHLIGAIFGFCTLLYIFKLSTCNLTVYFFVPLIVTWVVLKAAFESNPTLAPQVHNPTESLLTTSALMDYSTPSREDAARDDRHYRVRRMDFQ